MDQVDIHDSLGTTSFNSQAKAINESGEVAGDAGSDHPFSWTIAQEGALIPTRRGPFQRLPRLWDRRHQRGRADRWLSQR